MSDIKDLQIEKGFFWFLFTGRGLLLRVWDKELYNGGMIWKKEAAHPMVARNHRQGRRSRNVSFKGMSSVSYFLKRVPIPSNHSVAKYITFLALLKGSSPSVSLAG